MSNSFKYYSGCQESPASAGALLVNSINTSLLCGEPDLRPVKVLFRSHSLETGDTTQCGDTLSLALARRRDMRGGSQFVRTGNVSLSAPLSLRPASATVLQFSTDLTDTGGSLSVEVAILRSAGTGSRSVSVSGCLSQGYRSLPVIRPGDPGPRCRHGRALHQRSDPGGLTSTVYEQIVVLYPGPGPWYLSLSASCPEPGCSVPILFSVHTNQCFSGVCGKYGACHAYLSAGSGVFYSACSCVAGHRGPACNDPSLAVSDYQVRVILGDILSDILSDILVDNHSGMSS